MNLEPKHIEFLLELMNTRGLAFPMEKARLAVETLDRLEAMQAAQQKKPGG